MEGRAASQTFQIAAAGEQQCSDIRSDAARRRDNGHLHAVATVNGRDIESGMQVISYPHFPPQTLFPPSDMKLVRANIKVTAKKIGYIMGAGDEMPDALRQLGLDVTLLSQSDLEQGDLAASTPSWRGCALTTCVPTSGRTNRVAV